MQQFMEQLPIVVHALNVGFLQTLKLFFITLIGAVPLGLLISFGTQSKFAPIRVVLKVDLYLEIIYGAVMNREDLRHLQWHS